MVGVNNYPSCAVCGREVDPSVEHTVAKVETKYPSDKNELDEFYLHWYCARTSLGSWEEP